jgi:hypothetical protein
VPDNSITIGLDEALSLMVTVPDFAPCEGGEKATLIVQFDPGATLATQVACFCATALHAQMPS